MPVTPLGLEKVLHGHLPAADERTGIVVIRIDPTRRAAARQARRRRHAPRSRSSTCRRSTIDGLPDGPPAAGRRDRAAAADARARARRRHQPRPDPPRAGRPTRPPRPPRTRDRRGAARVAAVGHRGLPRRPREPHAPGRDGRARRPGRRPGRARARPRSSTASTAGAFVPGRCSPACSAWSACCPSTARSRSGR